MKYRVREVVDPAHRYAFYYIEKLVKGFFSDKWVQVGSVTCDKQQASTIFKRLVENDAIYQGIILES